MSQAPNEPQALASLFARRTSQGAVRSPLVSGSVRSGDGSTVLGPSLVTARAPAGEPEEAGWSSSASDDASSIPKWPARHGEDDMGSRRETVTVAGETTVAPSHSTIKSTSSKWHTVTTVATSSTAVSSHSVARYMHSGPGAPAPAGSSNSTPARSLPPMRPPAPGPPARGNAAGWSSEEDNEEGTTTHDPHTSKNSRRSTRDGSLNFCSVSTKSEASQVTSLPTPTGVVPDSSPSRLRGEALSCRVESTRREGPADDGWSCSDDDDDAAAAPVPAARARAADVISSSGTAATASPAAGGDTATWSSDGTESEPEHGAVPAPHVPYRPDPTASQFAVKRPPLAHAQGPAPALPAPTVRHATQALPPPKPHAVPSPSTMTTMTDACETGWSSDDEDARTGAASAASSGQAQGSMNQGLGALFPRSRPADEASSTPRHHSISVDHRDDSAAPCSVRDGRWQSMGQTMMSLQPLTTSATSGTHSRETFAEGLTLGRNCADVDPLALESPYVDELAYEKFCFAFAAMRLTSFLARSLRARGLSGADARSRVEAAHVAARELPRQFLLRKATSAGSWSRLVTVIEKALERVPLRNLTPQRAHPELCDVHVVTHAEAERTSQTRGSDGGWSDDEEEGGTPLTFDCPQTPNSGPERPAYTACDWLRGEMRAFSERRRSALGEWAALRFMTASRSAAHPESCGRTSGISADSDDTWDQVKSHIGMDEVVPGVFCGSWQPAADTAELARAGVSHVVSCINIRAPAPATTTMLDMNDRADQHIDPDSTTGLNAIRRHCFEAGRRVLVHCGSGVSRAPLIIVYALARMYELPADVATSIVRAGRPCICLNNGFRQQLLATFGPAHRDSSTDRSGSPSAKRHTPVRRGPTPPLGRPADSAARP